MEGDRHGGVLLIKRVSHSASEPVSKVSLRKFHVASVSEDMKPAPDLSVMVIRGWGMAGQSRMAHTESSARNLGDLPPFGRSRMEP